MDTLLHFGLSNALMATVLALPAALVGRLSQRPALAHGLWLLVVLKLLTPPFLPVPVWWLRSPGLETATAETSASLASNLETAGSWNARLPSAESSVPLTSSAAVPASSSAPSFRSSLPDPPRTAPAGLRWAWLVSLVWGLGAILWFATLGWRAYRFQRVLRGAQRAPLGLQERARSLAQRLGVVRCPGVWFVPGYVSPMLWALAGPPRLLLPRGLWSQLTDAQQDTLLAHELAHLRRRDHWVRWLELAAVGLYWWHPVAWWAQHELQETEEQCCDAWVVAVLPSTADAYAEALVATVAYLSRAQAVLAVGASGAGRVHLLKGRLIMILNGTTPKTLSPVGRWLVLALGAILLPLWPTWAHSQVPRASATVFPDDADAVARSADDEGRAEQLNQARATVRELTAELERMQAHVDTLARRLEEAQARLARLEGRSEPPATDALPRHRNPLSKTPPAATRSVLPHTSIAPAVKASAATQTAPALAPVPARNAIEGETTQTAPAPSRSHVGGTTPGGYQPGARPANQVGSTTRSDRHGGNDYDRRLRDVETKLDRLLKEIQALRERPANRTREPGDY